MAAKSLSLDKLKKIIAKKSFCTLATASKDGKPHVVGVIYKAVGLDLYIHAGIKSKKVRNIYENPRIAICIPVRKYPMGPPYCIQFQGTGEVFPINHPEIVRLFQEGKLKKIGDIPQTCFIRARPEQKIFTYGLGVPLRTILRHPEQGQKSVRIS